MNVLVVCSANRCRSPMAAALLTRHLHARSMTAEVVSAGLGPSGQPALPDTIAVMADIGVDLTGHHSRQVTAELCARADLIIAMTRDHVIELVVLSPSTWPVTFPLTDLVDRAHQLGPRAHDETPQDWIHRAHGGRQRSTILALKPAGDIADPVGQSRTAFERTRRDLDGLLGDLATLIAPTTTTTNTATSASG